MSEDSNNRIHEMLQSFKKKREDLNLSVDSVCTEINKLLPDNGQVNISTVYRWLNKETSPRGEALLAMQDWINQ